jgi:hypothetical protein
MAKVNGVSVAIVFVCALFGRHSLADKIMSVSLQQLTNDSDVVFSGRAAKLNLIAGGFKFVDTDGVQKSLDAAITTFSVDRIFKGHQTGLVEVCSILSPSKFANIDLGKTYIMFLQNTGAHLQRTYGSLSQIEIVDDKIGLSYLGATKDLDSLPAAFQAIQLAASENKKRFRSSPYNPYGQIPYKIISNPCSSR